MEEVGKSKYRQAILYTMEGVSVKGRGVRMGVMKGAWNIIKIPSVSHASELQLRNAAV